MRLVEWFKKVSCLVENKDKTKVIKVGAIGDWSIAWEGKFGLNWRTDFKVVCIKYTIDHMDSITEDNYISSDLKKLIAIWKNRNLTRYGKFVIIKSLLFSEITHTLLSYPSPSRQAFPDNDKYSQCLLVGR